MCVCERERERALALEAQCPHMETIVREAQHVASQLMVQGKSPGRTRTEAWQKLLSSASNLGRLAKVDSVSKLHPMGQNLKSLHLLYRGWRVMYSMGCLFQVPLCRHRAEGQKVRHLLWGAHHLKVVLCGMVDHEGSVWSEVTDIQQSNIHDVHLPSTHFDVHLVKSQRRSWG